MQKPEYLYHASHDTNVTEFEPRNEFPRYDGERNLVFATPYTAVAAMFLAPKNIAVVMSKIGDRHVLFVNGTEETFQASDREGAIYTLPSDSFETDPDVGMGYTEWASPHPVKPVSKTIYATATEALKEHGVEVFFLSETVFDRVKNDPSHALDIIQKP